jgi:hypothetical protein
VVRPRRCGNKQHNGNGEACSLHLVASDA